MENSETEFELVSELSNYALVRDRERRVIKPSVMYGYADLIAFSLSVSEELDDLDPRTYLEAVKSKDS